MRNTTLHWLVDQKRHNNELSCGQVRVENANMECKHPTCVELAEN